MKNIKKNILVIGSGGREHAIAWKLALSSQVEKIYVIPGNEGMKSSKIIPLTTIKSTNFNILKNFVLKKNIYFTIVGPEKELALGIVDFFEKNNLLIFGPNKYCAQLETSKTFAKQQMKKFKIKTASYKSFLPNYTTILNYLKKQKFPIVIKVDGLAAGKGVVIPHNLEDAKKYLKQIILEKKFGEASKKIIVEEFLIGQEFSLFALVNNKTIAYLQTAKDYKKALDHDRGENTGGMGAITPVNNLTKNMIIQGKNIISKIVNGLAKTTHPYRGVLYAGLIATKDGVKVIEFNARFGDPEIEVILLALKSDFFMLIDQMLKEKLLPLKWSKKYFNGVVLAANGYPEKYKKFLKIKNVKTKNNCKNAFFYMNIQKDKDNNLVSAGGRVLIAISSGRTEISAKNNVYKKIEKFNTDDFFFRKDIGR